MSTTPSPHDEVVAAAESSSQSNTSFSQTAAPGSTQSTSIDQSTSHLNSNTSHSAVHRFANEYNSNSVHNNPIYAGPVYNIRTANFTDPSRPASLSPPSTGYTTPSAPWASQPHLLSPNPFPTPPPSSPHATNASPLNDTTPSPSRSGTPMGGRWMYVPERSPSAPPNSISREPEPEILEVTIPPEVEEASRDYERQLKAAFQGFLAKEHQPLDPSLSPLRGRDDV